MYKPLPTPSEMVQWDRLAIEKFGLLPEILMENASRAALNILKDKFDSLKGKSALVFAGSGNNGGDAFALARHLCNHDMKLMILHTRRRKEYTAETAYHLNLLQKMDVNFMYLPEYDLDFIKNVDIIIDGLLGTGFSGQLREKYISWIKAINKLGQNGFVLSLDIPSGIDGLTGKPSPIAVKAHATITFEEAKLGLFLPPAKPFVGELIVGKIGIPKKIKKDHPCTHYALTTKVLNMVKKPKSTMHKGEAGHVLILGGSCGLTGAPLLAALGAIRSGAGLVTIGCPEDLAHEIKCSWPDIMTLPLGQGKEWDETSIKKLKENFFKFDAVVFGPGLGRTSGALKFLQKYLSIAHPKTIFDADSLYFFANHPELFNKIHTLSDVIFTPHPGEMARFFNTEAAEINRHRAKFAREFTQKFKTNLVLKGAATIISSPNSPILISPFATPNLALGGSGDILAGMIGSLLGQGFSALDASSVAVYWHGLAGKKLKTDFPYRGNLAQEIAHILPQTLAEAKNDQG
ncbi:NAD(P)H-hydrate dehydratase [Desulfovulcanus sp.]